MKENRKGTESVKNAYYPTKSVKNENQKNIQKH